jgi:hypothetical protein
VGLHGPSLSERVACWRARQRAGPRVRGVSMSDRTLFIGWGTSVRGSEGRGLEVFNEALGLLGRIQQEGRIDDSTWFCSSPTAT